MAGKWRSTELELQSNRPVESLLVNRIFDGVSVDLAKGSVIPFPDRTPATGDSRPMRIVVPPVTALAGRYSDRITLSITAM